MIPRDAVVLVLGLCCACADGSGTLVVRISGEDAVKQGLPVFADGWSVALDKYVVAVADLTIRAADGAQESDATVHIADLHRGDAELVELGGIAAQRWEGFDFAVRAPQPDDEVEVNGPARGEDVAVVQGGDYDLLIGGTATKDGRVVTFEWPLANPRRNRDCTNGVDGTQGVVVRNNTVTEAEITVHVEHAFWDTLGSEQTTLRFEAIAAMADESGAVAFDRLADQRLADLRDADGETLLDEQG